VTAQSNAPELMEFKDSINAQLEALKTAGRGLFDKQIEAKNPVPREISVEIRISLDPPESSEHKPTQNVHVECYWHTYVGGHMLDGTPYYVLERVCIEGVLGIGEA
jgi:hypothetical protein